MLVNQKAVKDFCKDRGRRVSPTFVHALNKFLVMKLTQACNAHNGGKITLDDDVCRYVGMDYEKVQIKEESK
jgi:hypothetical protein